MIREGGHRQVSMDWGRCRIAVCAIATAFVLAVAPSPASAQATLNDALSRRVQPGQPGQGTDKLLVDANEIRYDNDKNTVSAIGNVHLYYKGKTLQADRVVYDRNANRVLAEGNARITDSDGTVTTADRFELTDDFKDGFVNSLRVQRTAPFQGRPVTTRFSAPRAERTSGETTVFEKGTYTACEPCADHPERPPLWQVRAARIIHNNSERMIYYEDARLEFAGVPVAWIPYFSSPDPTVKRKSGFLAPHYVISSALGYGVGIPYFWNIAPNMDLTVTPTFLTRQGFLGIAEWRHRLDNGQYTIRAAGISQRDKDAFLGPLGPGLPALGARDKDFRGSIESAGRFFINPNWQVGWDVVGITDKWFLQNYKIKSESISSIYFRESTSTVYLSGKSDTAYFDLRGYYFKPLTFADWQKQQPLVHPVWDYNKRFQGPELLGGEVAFDANVTSLSRDAAYFQQVPTPNRTLFGLYDTCSVFQRYVCTIRGLGGSYSRATAEVSWRRSFVDPIGQMWIPFASLRTDGKWVQPDFSQFQNVQQANFGVDDNAFWRAMPAVGLEYRFPFVSTATRLGTHTIEPIAQIVIRPNEARSGRLPNEDAQSLVFSDATIFDVNKFSGYDRVEGGVRTNYGAKYTITTSKGYADVLVGQSYQVAGRNSYLSADLANTGLDSGLESRASDYVGRIHIAPDPLFSFTARSRFDEHTFALKRIELQGNTTFGPLTATVVYGHYSAQPNLSIPEPREGVLTGAIWKLTPSWSLNGSVLFDLSREAKSLNNLLQASVLPAQAYVRTPLWQATTGSLGVQYQDECTTFSVLYSQSFNDPTTGLRTNNQTVLVRLELRTLGQAALSQNLSGAAQDGVAQ